MAEEARGRAVNPACPNAENPFHRCAAYCPVPAPSKAPPAQNGKARGDGEAGGRLRQAVNPDCPNAKNRFHRCAEYCPVAAPASSKNPPAQNGIARDDGEAGGKQRQAVNPDCPNAENPFHRCAEYCPVAAPAASKPPPDRAAGQNGTPRGDGEEAPPARAAQNGTPRGDGEEAPPARAAQNGTPRGDGEEAQAGERQRKAVNPDCPNAVNPFHRCAEYCPVPAPAPAAVKTFPLPPGPGREIAQNGRAHSDGDLKPREERRRDRPGGSGGLPLYVFLREGSDGEGKKVDPRCPNAANPFHVCTDHCLPKMVDAGRSSEGGKSPLSLFSRRSGRSSSSSEDGSVKSKGSKKSDSKCPNAGNPFHECGEHCTAKIKEVEKQKKMDKQSPRKKGGKDIAVVQNWKVDPRCPNAGNPFHICAQYCFDYLNEVAPTAPSKPDSRKGKAVMK